MFRPKSPLKPSKQGINAMLLIGGLGASFLLITTLIIALSTKELDSFLFWFNLIGFLMVLGVIRFVLRRPGMYELPPPPSALANVDPSQGYYVPPAYVNHSPGPFAHGVDVKPQMRPTIRGRLVLMGTFLLGFVLMFGLMALLAYTSNLSEETLTKFLITGIVIVSLLSPNVLRLPGMREPKP